VHHHESERDERERDQQQELLRVARLPATHASSSTRRRNVSPRCSKLSNWSKLAVAGERRTMSPASASRVAARTAVTRSPARSYVRPAASRASASSSDATPIK